MERGAEQATVHGVAKELDTAQPLNNKNNIKKTMVGVFFCELLPTSGMLVVFLNDFKSYLYTKTTKTMCFICYKYYSEFLLAYPIFLSLPLGK